MNDLVIPAQRKRALLRALLFIAPSIAVFVWLRLTPSCTLSLGLYKEQWSVLFLCYGIPLLWILAAALYALPMAVKTFRHGYFPPLDSILFRDTQAKRGTPATLAASGLLIILLMAISILVYGHFVYREFAQGQNLFEIRQDFDKKCTPQIQT